MSEEFLISPSSMEEFVETLVFHDDDIYCYDEENELRAIELAFGIFEEDPEEEEETVPKDRLSYDHREGF